MAPPRGDRKKGKGAGGKTDLRPDRKQFKKHRKEEAASFITPPGGDSALTASGAGEPRVCAPRL